MSIGHAEDFRRVDVHHPRIERDDGLALGVGEAADAEAAEASSGTAHLLVLIFVSELGDAPDDDGVNAQQLAQLGGGGRICAVAVRKILLGKNLVKRLALDHRVGAVLDEESY